MASGILHNESVPVALQDSWGAGRKVGQAHPGPLSHAAAPGQASPSREADSRLTHPFEVVMLRSLLVPMLLAVSLLGCGDDESVNPDSGDPTKVTYAESLNVDLAEMTRLESGLYIQDTFVVEDGAQAQAGNRVQVRYTGYLPDGRSFDATGNGPAIGFTLGTGQVIAGWDEGIAGMRVGSRRRLVIPSSLGYGATGSGRRIPPYTVLIFDTELVSVR
ncbi:peptidylprolyl isomerase [Myxococcus xanthus]|nr:peptidylprolyl isomerase [Myxococcus xanthus]